MGRAAEAARVAALLGSIRTRGDVLVVRGAPGVGKSALLDVARRVADGTGIRVLSAVGFESESHLAFAGLHRLLSPVLSDAQSLPVPRRTALLGAFGLAEAEAPDLFLIALAALDLLAGAAARTPLLLVVDDVHWLDRASADVLGFLAMRLSPTPMVLLAAARDGLNALRPPLPELLLGRLDADAAQAVLDAAAPGLDPLVRERLLEEAAGNPLALRELPANLPAGPSVPGPARLGWLPLSARLEEAFSARIAGLPTTTCTLLRVVALNDHDAMSEVLAAAAILTGAPATAGDLAPAIEAGLLDLDVDLDRVRFRHPLMRSALRQRSSVVQRQSVHAALAEVVGGEPSRCAWHRAGASPGPDEDVAALLDAAATVARSRGGIEEALAAVQRAARLSTSPAARRERLVRAAELAAELGRREVVRALLAELEPQDLSDHQFARIAHVRDALDDGIRDATAGARYLGELAERVAADGDADLGLQLLWNAARRCVFAEPGPEVVDAVVTAAERIPVPRHDPRVLAILAYTAPVGRGADVIAGLHEAPAPTHEDPMTALLLGGAALAVGAYDRAAATQAVAVGGLRARGRLALLARALSIQAMSAAHLGDLELAVAAADEAIRLAEETSQPKVSAVAWATRATASAMSGDHEGVERQAAQAEQSGLAAGARPTLAMAQWARGLSALGSGRHADAYHHLMRLRDPADPASCRALHGLGVAELAEAALHSDHRDTVAPVLRTVEAFGRLTPSPSLHVGLRLARALLGDDGDADAHFRHALAADLRGWPFARASAMLAYGEWLRRQRRIAESRAHLRAAHETFDALGAVPWADRARRELRASGESPHRGTPEAHAQLSPQESEIVRMAGQGLTNREIGQRLHLSHRTVSSYLHHIFPKLGVTSRSELRRWSDGSDGTPVT